MIPFGTTNIHFAMKGTSSFGLLNLIFMENKKQSITKQDRKRRHFIQVLSYLNIVYTDRRIYYSLSYNYQLRIGASCAGGAAAVGRSVRVPALRRGVRHADAEAPPLPPVRQVRLRRLLAGQGGAARAAGTAARVPPLRAPRVQRRAAVGGCAVASEMTIPSPFTRSRAA